MDLLTKIMTKYYYLSLHDNRHNTNLSISLIWYNDLDLKGFTK